MENEKDHHDTSSIEDAEFNKLQISPAGEGDVKSCQSSSNTKINEILDSKNESSNTVTSQSTKKSFFSRFLGISSSRDADFSRDAIPNFASEDAHKYKSNSLGKLFRNKSASTARHENFDRTMINDPKSSRTPTEQSFKKTFGSLFSTLRGSRGHANTLPWNQASNEETIHLEKQRGGSLGKFFRYGHGKKGKSESQDKKGTTSTLQAIESESEFVTLPLDSPFNDESEHDSKTSSPKENQMRSNSSPRIESENSPRNMADY